MLKKVTGGVSLLIFVFTFVIPLLIFTNDAYSHDNQEDWYEWTIEYVCLNGEVAWSTVEWRVTKWSDGNHPEDQVILETICWDEKVRDQNGVLVKIRICEEVPVSYHRSHPITYRLYEDYGTETRSGTPNMCRRFR